jgi:ubiquinone/menaquinone biosynthesis C-methylase UbiE
VSDRSHQEELDRLLIHDQMFTTALGGVLPEQADPASFGRVLDIGCGPGGWLLETARTYPSISLLVGVDISEKMIGYAQAQASAQGLAERVKFYVMDALRPLDFPAEHFDLVNERFGTSWLRVWDWPPFLQECQRLTRPGGVVRVTEFNLIVESSSPALVQLGELAIRAFHQAGHLFHARSDGLTKELARLLHQSGLENVQTRAPVLEYRAGTPEGKLFAEDWAHLFRVIAPFLHKWTRVSEDYEALYQQMLQDFPQPDFVAISRPLTAWGTRSLHFSLPVVR